jgi:hypothetical protein
MRSSRISALSLFLLAGGLGCSNPQSFIILVLESSTTTPIVNVSEVSVMVTQGTTEMQVLNYPAGNLSIVPDADVNMGTLSVSFSGSQSGDVVFTVTALDAHGCAIGTGNAEVSIIKGGINEAIVFMSPEQLCPGDGGAPDAPPDGSGFPGCDPASVSCPDTQSCQVNCQTHANVCAMAGNSPAGGTCSSTVACAPGGQCFDYTSLGCATQLCLRFCATDNDCASPGDGGVGPGSFCRDPVACGGVTTAYHTCTFSCEPTAAATTAGKTGCPTGLACVMPSNMDHVDCACVESTRTGKEGTACTSTTQCAPGFLCQTTCRAVCRCDAANGACTAANDCPTSGTTCKVLPGETRYGLCQ